MAKRPKNVAPVSYQVPFETAEPDASRAWAEQSDYNIPASREMQQYAMSGLMGADRFLQNPMPAMQAGVRTTVDLINPVPTFVQAGKSMTEFAQKPSWKGAGRAAFDVGMAGLDASMVGDVAKLGKKPIRSAISRLGRY